jgi:hypothetical protein
MTHARKETTDATERHEWNQEPRFQGAATSWKREENQRDLQEVIGLETVKRAVGVYSRLQT